jgi:hypothetical protein
VAAHSKYAEEYCDGIIEYFEKARSIFNRDEIGTTSKRTERPNNSGKSKIINYKSPHPLIILPTLERYSSTIGVSVRTLHRWKNKDENFKAAVDQCMAIQREMLIQMGLNGHYNIHMVKLILYNCHNWTDKQELVSYGNITLNFTQQDRDA